MITVAGVTSGADPWNTTPGATVGEVAPKPVPNSSSRPPALAVTVEPSTTVPSDRTAATLPFDANSAGAAVSSVAPTVADVPAELVTVTETAPVLGSAGASTLICVGLT